MAAWQRQIINQYFSFRLLIQNTSEDEAVKVAKKESIQHETKCVECGGDESLILCAECPDVYHLECHNPPLRRPPR